MHWIKLLCSIIINIELWSTCIHTGTSEFEVKSWWKSRHGFDPSCPKRFSNKSKELFNCQLGQVREANQNQLAPIALSEAACIRPIGRRLMIPFTWGSGQGEEIIADSIGNIRMWAFATKGFFIPSLQVNQTLNRNQF